MLLDLDWNGIVNHICSGIRSFVPEDVKGVVLGLSGGVDSSVVAYLSVKALGPDRVLGLLMPDSDVTPRVDVDDALIVAENLGINYRVIDIKPVMDSFSSVLKPFSSPSKLSMGNLRARVRMCINYYFANLEGWLVAGSGDRSEILLGYFTKYGDGGCDFLPIGSLYKTQVRRLASFLEVPDGIVSKPSSPALWPGHLAEVEIGYSYEFVDKVLYLMFDLGLSPFEVASKLNVDLNDVMNIKSRVDSSSHKRIFPKIIEIPMAKYRV